MLRNLIPSNPGRVRTICLTGAHGTGKSVFGIALARELDAYLVDNVGTSGLGIFTQPFITVRYTLKLIRGMCISQPTVTTRSYLDQLVYAKYYGSMQATLNILHRLVVIQLQDPTVFFLHIPPTGELVGTVQREAKKRPPMEITSWYDKCIVEYLGKYCEADRCISLPVSLQARDKMFVEICEYLKARCSKRRD